MLDVRCNCFCNIHTSLEWILQDEIVQHSYSSLLHLLAKSNHISVFWHYDMGDVQEQESVNKSFKLQSLKFWPGSKTRYLHPFLLVLSFSECTTFLKSICGLWIIPEETIFKYQGRWIADFFFLLFFFCNSFFPKCWYHGGFGFEVFWEFT